MANIPQSNYVNINFTYSATSSIVGSVPNTILFGDDTSITAETTYTSLADVLTDYENTTDVYKASALYFNNGGKSLILVPLGSSSASADALAALQKYPEVVCVSMLNTTNIDISEMAELLYSNEENFAYKKILIVASGSGVTDPVTPTELSTYGNTVLMNVPTSAYKTYAPIGIAGVLSGYDATKVNSIMPLQFQQLSGMDSFITDATTGSAVNALVTAGWCVMVNVANKYVFLDGAQLVNGEPIHSAWGFSVLKNNLENAVFNALLEKLPYATSSETTLQNVINGICNQFITNGLISTNSVYTGATQSVSYNGTSYTLITQNVTLTNGYLVYEIPIENASDTDKSAGKIPPIYVFVVINDAIRMVEITGEVRK